MVKVLKYLLYVLFFIYALIYFLPKQFIYFYAEEYLENEKVVISSESSVEKSFGLKIEDAQISYKSIQSANIKEIEIDMVIFYNSIRVENIELSKAVASIFPQNIDNIDIKYSLLKPLNMTINAKGEFGEANGYLDIVEKKFSMKLKASKLMKSRFSQTLKNFRKNAQGEYIYEQNI
jgi:hypothetical protein